MKLEISSTWLESFPHDEPRGYTTLHDRDVQAQHQSETKKTAIAEAVAAIARKQNRRTKKGAEYCDVARNTVSSLIPRCSTYQLTSRLPATTDALQAGAW